MEKNTKGEKKAIRGKAVIERTSYKPQGARKKQKDSEESSDKKIKYSNFLVTINTNYKPYSNEDFLDKQVIFESALDVLFDKDEFGNNKLVKFVGDGIGDKWDAETILDFYAHTAIEIGKQKGRLHSHTMLAIKHRTQLQIDGLRVKQVADELLQDFSKGTKVWVQYANPNVARIIRYVKKDQPTPSFEELQQTFDNLSLKG